jgi:hypothetical protein
MTFTIHDDDLAPATAEEQVSDTTLVFSPTAAVPADKLAILLAVWDNVNGDNADDTTLLSVGDSKSNTWLRAGEAQFSTGVALDGVLAGIFYSVITTQIETGDTITVTSTANGTAKGCALATFNRDTGKVINVVGVGYERIAASAVYSASVSGLASEEHLWIGTNAVEADRDVANNKDATFNNILQGGSGAWGPGGADIANVGGRGGYKIATDTGETYDNTAQSTRDRVTILVAFNEAFPLDQSFPTRRTMVA